MKRSAEIRFELGDLAGAIPDNEEVIDEYGDGTEGASGRVLIRVKARVIFGATEA